MYIQVDDRKHGNAELLRAVFGRDFRPDPTTLFPGRWRATINAFGMVQATFDLELRANSKSRAKAVLIRVVLRERLPVSLEWSSY